MAGERDQEERQGGRGPQDRPARRCSVERCVLGSHAIPARLPMSSTCCRASRSSGCSPCRANQLGSWVAITFDNKGRLIASDQEKKGLVPHHAAASGQLGAGQGRASRREDHGGSGDAVRLRQSVRVGQRRSAAAACIACATPTATINSTRWRNCSSIAGGGEHGPHGLRAVAGRQVASSSSAATTRTCRRSSTPAASRPTGARTCCCRASGTPTATPAAAWRPAAGLPRPIRTARSWDIFSVGYRNAYDIGLQRRRRAVRLRRRHGMGHGHAVVSADAGHARHQRQRVRLAQRHWQMADVLRR